MKDKVAIVTGGAGGIGEAIVRKLGTKGVKVVATGRTETPPLLDIEPPHRPSVAATRRITWAGQTLDVPVHRRSDLGADSLVTGPAIVTEETTTIVVPPGFELWTDRLGNGVLYRSGTDVQAMIRRLGAAGGTARVGAAEPTGGTVGVGGRA